MTCTYAAATPPTCTDVLLFLAPIGGRTDSGSACESARCIGRNATNSTRLSHALLIAITLNHRSSGRQRQHHHHRRARAKRRHTQSTERCVCTRILPFSPCTFTDRIRSRGDILNMMSAKMGAQRRTNECHFDISTFHF